MSDICKLQINTIRYDSHIDSAQFFEFTDTGHDLRGHNLKLSQLRNRSRVRRTFFSQRVVVDWNRLPQYVVDAQSTNAFKNRLDKYWRDDMGAKDNIKGPLKTYRN